MDQPDGAGPVLSAQRLRLARGRSWLNSRRLVARINFATALVDGSANYPPVPADVLGLVERTTGGTEAASGVRLLSQVLLGSEPPPALQKQIQAVIGNGRR